MITGGTILTFNDVGLAFVGSGALALVPMPVVLWIGAAIVAGLVVRRTALGFMIEAVGVNPRAAVRAGVNTRALLIAV